MSKYIVNRRTWHRGKGSNGSKLLRIDGQRCCIGFVGQQCGYDDESLRDVPYVHSHLKGGETSRWPSWLLDISKANTAYRINDDATLNDNLRESQLRELFAAHGDEIEFVGE